MNVLMDDDEPSQLGKHRRVPAARREVPFFRRTQKINDEFDAVRNSLLSSMSAVEADTQAVRSSLDASLHEKEDLRRDLNHLVAIVREAVTLCHVADAIHAPPLAASDDEDIALESIDVEDESIVAEVAAPPQPAPQAVVMRSMSEVQARKPFDDGKKVGTSSRKQQGTKEIGTPLRSGNDTPLTIDFDDPMITPIPLRPATRDFSEHLQHEQRFAQVAERAQQDLSSSVVRPFVLDLQPSRAAFVKLPTTHHTSPPPRLPSAWMSMDGLATANNLPQSGNKSNDDEDLVVLLLRRQLQQREHELKEMLQQK